MNKICWNEHRLGDVTQKIGSGATPRGGKDCYLVSGDFALIRSQNVLDFTFSKNGLAYIAKDQADKLKNVELEEEDILLNITGDSVARVCQIPTDFLPARVNQHVAIIRPNPQVLNPTFLKYYLLNPEFKSYMLMLSSAGATRNAITKGMIEDFVIKSPNLPTQQAIAEILSSLDEKIELNNRINRNLEDLAQALFKRWFVDFEFPDENGQPYRSSGGEMVDSELGEIPKGWKSGTLSEIIDFNPVEKLPKGKPAPFLEMAALPVKGSYPELPFQREFTSGMKFRNGDTLLARITPCLENGKTAFIQCLGEKEIGWGSTEFIVLRPKPPYSKEIGYLIARNETFRNFAIQNLVGTSGRQRVQKELLMGFPFSFPLQLKLVKDFGIFVNGYFEMIKSNAEENIQLIKLRDTLLPKLISGDLEVNESIFAETT